MKETIFRILKENKTLVYIFLLATISRFIGLELQSYWADELYTVWSLNFPTFTEFIEKSIIPDVHPPLYNSILYYLRIIFSDSEIVMRGFSAILSIISIVLMYIYSEKLYNKKTAVLSSILMIVMWFPLYISQEARSYSLVLMLITIFQYYNVILLNSIIEGIKIKYIQYICFIVAGILLCYTHYYSMFFVFFSMIFVIKIPYKSMYKYLIPYIIIGISYLPWIPIMLQHLKYGKLWMGPLSIFSLIKSIDFITNNSIIISLLLFVFLALGIVMFFKNKNRMDNSKKNLQIYSIISIFVPFIIFYILSHISTPSFTYRHYIIIFPILIMYIANAITSLNNKMLSNIVSSLIILSSIFSTVVINAYYSPHKSDYRSLSQYISKNSKHCPVTIEGFKYIKQSPYIYDYYLRTYSDPRQMYAFDGDVSNVKQIISKIKSEYDCFWYIVDDYYNYKELKNEIFKYASVVEKKRYVKLTLFKMMIN